MKFNNTTKMIIILISLSATPVIAGFFDIFSPSEKNDKQTIDQVVVTQEVDRFDIENLPTAPTIDFFTKKKDMDFLKVNREEIILILHSFKSLEDNLSGYEEKSVISNLKNYFKDKYLIQQIDLISIKNNLNESLKYVEQKRNEDR